MRQKNNAPASGVYFSANDTVYPWTLAFLRSFRKFNPELPLYWIPFNDNSRQTAALSDEFKFKVYEDPSFTELEKLGEAYELGHSSYGKFWFRRYAAFWGPLDHFLYLDARQIVLADLSPLLQPLQKSALDFMYYDLAINQVYEPGDMRRGFLLNKDGRGFLSGTWGSGTKLFNEQELLSLGYQSLARREQLNPRNTDQGFINYCVDSKRLRTAQYAEWIGGIVHQQWARQSGSVYEKGGKYYLWDYGGLDHKKQVILLHWGGFRWVDHLPQSHILNTFSKPSFNVRVFRLMNAIKTTVKASFYFRRFLGHT